MNKRKLSESKFRCDELCKIVLRNPFSNKKIIEKHYSERVDKFLFITRYVSEVDMSNKKTKAVFSANLFRITHRPTGLLLIFGQSYLKEVRDTATELMKLDVNWRSKKSIKESPDYLKFREIAKKGYKDA